MASRFWETVLYRIPLAQRKENPAYSDSPVIIIPPEAQIASEPADTTPQDRLHSLFALVAYGILLIALYSFLSLFHVGLVIGLTLCLEGILHGAKQHRGDLLMLGSIVGSAALGVLLTSDPVHLASGYAEAGVFLVVFAAGWYATSLLSHLFTRTTQWWVLFPGSMMALTGVALFL